MRIRPYLKHITHLDLFISKNSPLIGAHQWLCHIFVRISFPSPLKVMYCHSSYSSTESKYKALSDTTTELSWLQYLLSVLGLVLPHAPILQCDNVLRTQLPHSKPCVSCQHLKIDWFPFCSWQSCPEFLTTLFRID